MSSPRIRVESDRAFLENFDGCCRNTRPAKVHGGLDKTNVLIAGLQKNAETAVGPIGAFTIRRIAGSVRNARHRGRQRLFNPIGALFSRPGNTKPSRRRARSGRGPSTSPFLNRERAEHARVRVNRFGSELCQILSFRNAFWRDSRQIRAWPPYGVTLSL